MPAKVREDSRIIQATDRCHLISGANVEVAILATAPDVVGERVRITHTLTTPGCPMEGIITAGIRSAVGRVAGVGAVETNLVWDPMWHSGMIAPGAW